MKGRELPTAAAGPSSEAKEGRARAGRAPNRGEGGQAAGWAHKGSERKAGLAIKPIGYHHRESERR